MRGFGLCCPEATSIRGGGGGVQAAALGSGRGGSAGAWALGPLYVHASGGAAVWTAHERKGRAVVGGVVSSVAQVIRVDVPQRRDPLLLLAATTRPRLAATTRRRLLLAGRLVSPPLALCEFGRARLGPPSGQLLPPAAWRAQAAAATMAAAAVASHQVDARHDPKRQQQSVAATMCQPAPPPT